MNGLVLVGLTHLKSVLIDRQRDTIMENNEEIISRLKFIGYIEKDEKINVRHVNRQPNTIYTKLSRTLLYPDNRFNSLKFIKDVVMRVFDIIQHYIFYNDLIVCKSVITDLIKAKQGILNLKYTYADDTKLVCDYEILIGMINAKLLSLKESHPELLEEKEVVKEVKE